MLGCGVPPRILVTGESGETEIEFSEAWLRQHCEATETEYSAKTAKLFWGLADYGELWDMLGVWDHCPRWYDVFADPLTSAHANQAIDAAWWLEAGCLPAYCALPLLPYEAELIPVATQVGRTLRAAQMAPKTGGEDGSESSDRVGR